MMDFFSKQQLDLLRRTRADAKTEAEKAVLMLLAVKKEISPRDVQRKHIVENAYEARALLDKMVRAGKLVDREIKPERGGHPICYYVRCDD